MRGKKAKLLRRWSRWAAKDVKATAQTEGQWIWLTGYRRIYQDLKHAK